jgi:hypothetical protein
MASLRTRSPPDGRRVDGVQTPAGRLAELTSRFRDDILPLEHLLDRDLSHWLQEST